MRKRKDTSALGQGTPVYTFPNGSVVPPEVLAQLLADPNTQVTNVDGGAGATQPATQQVPQQTQQAPPVGNQGTPVYTYPNGTVIPPDVLAQLLADPNTQITNPDGTTSGTQAPATQQTQPATQPTQQTPSAGSQGTPVYTYPNGTVIPPDVLAQLLADPNTQITNPDGTTSGAQAPATQPTQQAPPAENQGTPVYTYPNGTVIPPDVLAQLLADPNTQITNPDGTTSGTQAPATQQTQPTTQPTSGAVDQSTAPATENQGTPVYTYPNGTVVPPEVLAQLLADPNTQITNPDGTTSGTQAPATQQTQPTTQPTQQAPPAENQGTPVYTYPNGTVIPPDVLEQLLADPNTQIVNPDGTTSGTQAPATQQTQPTTQPTQQTPPAENQGTPVYTYPNGTVVPPDVLEQLLADPNTKITNSTDGSEIPNPAAAGNTGTPQTTNTGTQAPADQGTPVYTFPNGTVVPPDVLAQLLADPNTLVDGVPVGGAQSGATNPTTQPVNQPTTNPTTPPTGSEGTPVYTFPNGTVVPPDVLAQLLADPNTMVNGAPVGGSQVPSAGSVPTTQPVTNPATSYPTDPYANYNPYAQLPAGYPTNPYGLPTGAVDPLTQAGAYNPYTGYPTTQYPTTQYPTTQYPTTQYPTTQYPTTQYPTTQLPTTQYPTTQYPATQYPMTQYPTTQYPTTQYPTTQLPITQYPTTQYPTTQYPTAQYPTTSMTNPYAGYPTTPYGYPMVSNPYGMAGYPIPLYKRQKKQMEKVGGAEK